tara:strand:- start:49 stop:492 length:444 start_codon:yes stop_codon:yes gene_type:complete
MRWYESALLCIVITFLYSYLDKEFNWLFFLVCGLFILIPFFESENDKNWERIDWERIVTYAIIAFLYNPFFTYLHYANNMPIYGMSPSDFTDVFYMFGRAFGAFAFASILALLTLLFNPKKKWETYWLVTLIISIISGTLVISSNSF